LAGERYRQDERERERSIGCYVTGLFFPLSTNRRDLYTHTKLVTKYWHERVYFKGTPDS